MHIRIATRRSQLALAQAHWIRSQLEALGPEVTVELKEYVTRGDRIQNVPLPEVGGKGLFTKEIEDALLAGEADLAVHSLKDLPGELPQGLALACVPPREDARDVVVLPVPIGPSGSRQVPPSLAPLGLEGLAGIPHGYRIGSSSLRRSAQVRHARPDLTVENVRGNVDTRLRKLDEGQYDALILAAAGLRRLGLGRRISSALPVEISTPAPGQGALGLETREDDAPLRELLARLEDADTRACVQAERSTMAALGGGCSVPLGVFGQVAGEELRVIGVVAAPDGSRLVREAVSGAASEAEALGRDLAERLLAAGAGELLESR